MNGLPFLTMKAFVGMQNNSNVDTIEVYVMILIFAFIFIRLVIYIYSLLCCQSQDFLNEYCVHWVQHEQTARLEQGKRTVLVFFWIIANSNEWWLVCMHACMLHDEQRYTICMISDDFPNKTAHFQNLPSGPFWKKTSKFRYWYRYIA